MAQTGYTPIQIYSSSTGGNTPLAASLTNNTLGSELAINIADGKLFYKDSGGAVQVIGWKVVPTTAGGTGLTSYTAGDTLYYSAGSTLSKLGIGSSGYYMSSSGSAPQWSAPAALTSSNDTNVTVTLGGSASTALLNAASITMGWTGQLGISRGGTNQSSFTSPSASVAGLLWYNGTALQNTATPTNLGFNSTTNTFYTANAVLGTGSSSTLTLNGTSVSIPNSLYFATNLLSLDNTNKRIGFGISSPVFPYQFNTASGYNVAITGGYTGTYTSIRGVNDNGSSYIGLQFESSHIMLNGESGNGVSVGTTTNPGAGNLLVGPGNLSFGTAAKGINFTANTPAAGMTSQLLNWYEEGTWTPSWTFATPGTLSITYGTRTGYYTRIGRQVFVQVALEVPNGNFSKGTASGQLALTGLPYVPKSTTNTLIVISANSTDLTCGDMVLGIIGAGSSQIVFETMSVVSSTVTKGFASVSASNFAATNTGYISTYFWLSYNI
jgi:hypothetical protein